MEPRGQGVTLMPWEEDGFRLYAVAAPQPQPSSLHLDAWGPETEGRAQGAWG